MKHAGLVLAAGASTRMGEPKALLLTPEGVPLAQHQATLLRHAGCDEVLVVLGRDFEFITNRIPNCKTICNPNWETGRFSSIQTGLRTLHAFGGCLILPVDTVGVSLKTLEATREFAEQLWAGSPDPARGSPRGFTTSGAGKPRPQAVRPTFNGADGKIAWISKQLAAEIARAETADTRLDLILKEKAVRFPVNDPAILNNVNTQEEWKKLKW
jgi:CTP:molybdopterin cytidylyltransferase MocA